MEHTQNVHAAIEYLPGPSSRNMGTSLGPKDIPYTLHGPFGSWGCGPDLPSLACYLLENDRTARNQGHLQLVEVAKQDARRQQLVYVLLGQQSGSLLRTLIF